MTLRAVVCLQEASGSNEAHTAALQAFVKSKLAPYKYPRIIDYVAVLPKTGTGKIDRQALTNLSTPQT